MIDAAADLQEIFAAGELTRTVQIQGQEIEGIYRAPFSRAALHGDGVETSAPTLLVRDAALAALPQAVVHDDTLTLPHLGQNFEVIGIQPDGLGLTTLILTEA